MHFIAKDGTDVDLEKWGWIVEYKDGTLHGQFDAENERYNNFASIDIDNVKSVTMHGFETNKQYTVVLPDGAKLIHYYDNIISHSMGTGASSHRRIYCFGYELNGEKRIWHILPNDVVVEGVINNLEIL